MAEQIHTIGGSWGVCSGCTAGCFDQSLIVNAKRSLNYGVCFDSMLKFD